MILDGSNLSLRLQLAGAVATSELHYTVSYEKTCVECGLTNTQIETTTLHEASGISNGTSPVTMLQGPLKSPNAVTTCWYKVLNYTVWNNDTANSQPTVSTFDSNTSFTANVGTALLQPGGSLQAGPNGSSATTPSGGPVGPGSFPAVPAGEIVYGNGTGATSDGNLIWDPVNGALDIQGSINLAILIGQNAGSFASGASNSVFIGRQSGEFATNALDAVFIGRNAGAAATNAGSSIFVGEGSGNGATNASFSSFFGTGTGTSAANAAFSIFIGDFVGAGDTVNNTAGLSWSMLVGSICNPGVANINTGGFTNSIFLGGNSTASTAYANTANNQLYITDEISTVASKAAFYGNNNSFTAISPGANAGVGASTVFSSGTQFGGRLDITTGTGSSAGVIISAVYATAFPNDSFVVISNVNNNSVTLSAQVTSTSTGFTINTQVTPSDATNYIWNFFVTGY